ncbi:MAG: HEPN domain-containing protein [Alphaproteobacteria bacterium]|nr:HEPN domain-containing protein [Alphaproteobacteria bacterium]
MNIQDHIQYWLKSYQYDLESIEGMIAVKKYIYALFFAHLSTEKLLKALWIQNNNQSYPPKTHNLLVLVEKSNLQLTPEELKTLLELNNFNLESRYPDYLFQIVNSTDLTYTTHLINKIKSIHLCIQKQIL